MSLRRCSRLSVGPSATPPRLLPGTSGSPWPTRQLRVDGTVWGAPVIEDGVPVGAVLVAERGHDNEAAAYLFRRDDGARLLFELDDFQTLTTMLGHGLRSVQLGEWWLLGDDWPRDLESLLVPMLIVAGAD